MYEFGASNENKNVGLKLPDQKLIHALFLPIVRCNKIAKSNIYTCYDIIIRFLAGIGINPDKQDPLDWLSQYLGCTVLKMVLIVVHLP